jgi:hypothetical protein
MLQNSIFSQTEPLPWSTYLTDEIDAYDLLQQGRYQLRNFTPDGARMARENFRQAIALAPNLSRRTLVSPDVCSMSICMVHTRPQTLQKVKGRRASPGDR